MNQQFDVIVIGAGPGGYVSAIRCAQLGLKVAIVEKEKVAGGTCLRVGCIPSKALLESSEHYHYAKTGLSKHGVKVGSVELDLRSMMRRKDMVVTALTKGVDGLLKKNKVERVLGHGRMTGFTPGAFQVEVRNQDATTVLTGAKIILATGSVPTSLPGIELDGDRVGTSTEALSFPEVPQHLVVIGAGVIGLELGSVWARLGSKVSVVEYFDRIMPGSDSETAQLALKMFQKQGLEFHLGQKVISAAASGNGAQVKTESGLVIDCDRVLVAVGRKPYTEGLGLEEAGVKTERGRVVVDAHWQSNVAGIYAIGDLIDGPMLAHKAEDEGVAVAEQIVNGHGHVNYAVIPSIVYTHPEIAWVGKTEDELISKGIPYRKGSFPFIANGRARAMDCVEGQVKMLAHAETDRVLGVHIIGPKAGDLIAECASVMEFSGSSEDIVRTCHAHPTLSEVVREAALAVDGRAIHI